MYTHLQKIVTKKTRFRNFSRSSQFRYFIDIELTTTRTTKQ